MARHCLIACEVFYREFCAAVAESTNVVDVTFVEQGLHDQPSCAMAGQLQQRIDERDDGTYDAILLGYGLCNNGIVSLQSREAPLVVPRAHDCITLFMGSRHRYDRRFKTNPGCYYLTSGWIERGSHSVGTLPTLGRNAKTDESVYADYVNRFGEENAQFLMEVLSDCKGVYSHMAFINLDVGEVESLRTRAKEKARRRGLEFEELEGDLRLFRGLVDGPPWDQEEYLVVPPDRSIHPSYDGRIVESRAPACQGQRA